MPQYLFQLHSKDFQQKYLKKKKISKVYIISIYISSTEIKTKQYRKLHNIQPNNPNKSLLQMID